MAPIIRLLWQQSQLIRNNNATFLNMVNNNELNNQKKEHM